MAVKHKGNLQGQPAREVTMNTRLCVLLLISVTSLSAKAGWNGNGDIDDLFTKLNSVQTRLGEQGNISVTAAELRQQLTLLRSQGVEITSSAEEIRSEESREGKECVSTCRSGWSPN